MTKHYIDLTGATGDRIQFGAPRIAAASQFAGAAPAVRLHGQLHPLIEISPLGFTIEAAAEIAPADDDAEVIEAWFEQAGHVIASISILQPSRLIDGSVECLVFDSVLDLDALASANASAVARARLTSPVRDRDDVPLDYKLYCADLLDMLATHRGRIGREIGPLEPLLGAAERAEIDQTLEQSVRAEWFDLLVRGDQLILPYKYEDTLKPRLKRYTEKLVTRELCFAENWKRSYTKPMGYPGDFRIMTAVYDHAPQGADTYQRFLYVLGLLTGWPIATRMEYLVQAICGLRQGAPERTHFHVMSIGAGPARELRNFFAQTPDRPEGYSITLVDPEVEALNYAIGSIYGAIRRGLPSVLVSGLNVSFTEMLRPQSTFRHLPPQDLIYSAGLVDYLKPKLARTLISKLYEHLRPGGAVIIGNVNDAGKGSYWPLEYALDWSLFFRNVAEMAEIADGIPGEISIEPDESGAMYMLTVRKPA